jgi:hypothetical protein
MECAITGLDLYHLRSPMLAADLCVQEYAGGRSEFKWSVSNNRTSVVIRLLYLDNVIYPNASSAEYAP